MPIGFEIDERVAAVARRTTAFVQDVVIPEERACDGNVHAGPEPLRRRLQQAARDAGVFAPHVGAEWGGHGLDLRGQAVVFEEAGLLAARPAGAELRGTRRGQHAPARGGRHRGAEGALPAPAGRGRRPLLLRDDRARARRRLRPARAAHHARPGSPAAGGSTAASGSSPAPTARRSPSAWPAPSGEPGRRGRRHDVPRRRRQPRHDGSSGTSTPWTRACSAGTARSSSTTAWCADDAVLGEVDQGFAYAQVRLGPARMTHCMRWLGAARRAHDIALERAAERAAVRLTLADLGMVQQMIADNEIDIAASRALLIRRACWELDQGRSARQAHRRSPRPSSPRRSAGSSTARVQICGALGVSGDVPLARLSARGAAVPDLRRPVRDPPLGHRRSVRSGAATSAVAAQ